jgi:DNA-binding GntR family transcriptional regulator
MASADDVRDLRGASSGWMRAAAKGDVDTYAAANLDFHDRLVELTGNAKPSPPTGVSSTN